MTSASRITEQAQELASDTDVGWSTMRGNVDWDTETHEGVWWRPETPKISVGGTLLRDPAGPLRLRLLGWLGEWSSRAGDHMKDVTSFPVVLHGLVEGEEVTLFGCTVTNWSQTRNEPPSSVSVLAERALCGLHATIADEALFATARVRLDLLNEWADRPVFEVPAKSGTGSTWSQAVSYTNPAPVAAALERATVQLDRSVTTSYDPYSGATMESDESLLFTFSEALDIGTILHDYIRPVRNLIALAARRPCSILEFRVNMSTSDPYGATVLGYLRSSGDVSSTDMLFHQQDLGFDHTLRKWFDIHERLDIVCDLLASLRSNDNLANQFLNAASALESYHRRTKGTPKATKAHKERISRILAALDSEDQELVREKLRHSHEPTYLERLKELLSSVTPEIVKATGDPDRWARWMTDARNSVAHRDPKMVSIETEWRATLAITRSAEWLLVVLLLHDLGFSESALTMMLTRNPLWHRVASRMTHTFPGFFEESPTS